MRTASPGIGPHTSMFRAEAWRREGGMGMLLAWARDMMVLVVRVDGKEGRASV